MGLLKPKVNVKVNAKPKATAKVTTPKATTPKAKLHIKLKAGASTGAKAAVKTQAKKLEGTCPYAAKFGMTMVPAYEHTDKSVCKSLKSTCCDAKSMTKFAEDFKTWTANLSKTMWTLMRIPAMAGNVMGNLKLD